MSYARLQIPPVEALPTPVVVPAQKCRTCAYRVPARAEELDMMIGYYVEEPRAHACHERRGVFCLGSHDQVVELERLVERRIIRGAVR